MNKNLTILEKDMGYRGWVPAFILSRRDQEILMRIGSGKPAFDTFEVERVIFNDPATIVLWADGDKTVVKAQNEPFDPEKGLAMAFMKKALGNTGKYYNEIKKWTSTFEDKYETATQNFAEMLGNDLKRA